MIGIFDSGVGGLTVVKEIFKYLPEYQIIYFGDTAHLPYGTKGEGFVKEYSRKITDWLEKKGANLITIACHTSSSIASNYLKGEFKELPVFEMITPVIEEILDTTENEKIGIIGTPGTIKSRSYEKKLMEKNSSLKVFSISCPLFVPLVEEGWINRKETEMIIKNYLKPFKKEGIDTLVLACTHYPLLENKIKEVMGEKVKIINPAVSLAKNLKNFLKDNPKLEKEIKKGNNHKFFFSDTPYHLDKISNLVLGKKIDAEIINPF